MDAEERRGKNHEPASGQTVGNPVKHHYAAIKSLIRRIICGEYNKIT